MTRMETSRATTARQLRPYTRPLIKNAWYVAGWSEDFGEELTCSAINFFFVSIIQVEFEGEMN